MTDKSVHLKMLEQVANALGEDIYSEIVFIGGCTTSLLLTDEFSSEQVRHTDDVDLVCNIANYAKYEAFREQLRDRGFIEKRVEGDPTCAMYLNDLRVDIMSDMDSALGFTNRWYSEVLSNPSNYKINNNITIRVVDPACFVGTKLEAFKGRGNGDALSSRDIEDILHLIGGRAEIIKDISESKKDLIMYISHELKQLKEDDFFAMALQSTANDSGREEVLWERIEQIIELA
jgi:predicted nucleotidyltransferase